MVKQLNLGFESQKREIDYPYTTTIRCGDDTMKQLLDIKNYCIKHLEETPESGSAVIRQAIKFGSVFCQIQKSSNKLDKKARRGQ